jgi:hypothetical protein
MFGTSNQAVLKSLGSLGLLERLKNVDLEGKVINLLGRDVGALEHTGKTGNLLLEVLSAVLENSLHGANVVGTVLGSGTSERGDNLLSLSEDISGGGGNKLLNELTEILDETNRLLEATLSGAGSSGLLVNKLDEVSEIATTLITITLLVRLGEELQSGESRNVVLGGNVTVSISINLGNNDALLGLEDGTELVPNGSEGLAVSAPGSIELNKDILIGIDNLIKVGGSQDDDIGRRSAGLGAGAYDQFRSE